MSLRIIDLFAGAGGFSEGFMQAGFGLMLASDIHENSELTHLARYNRQLGLDSKFLRMDIQHPDFIPSLGRLMDSSPDVVVGGPPCQSFSLAGRRREGDPKDSLFRYYLNAVSYMNPKYFVMENVHGMLSKEKGAIWKSVIEGVESIGYEHQHFILNAKDYGVPQSRKRVFLIGRKKGLPQIPKPKESIDKPTISDAIGSILHPETPHISGHISPYPNSKYDMDCRGGRISHFKAVGEPFYYRTMKDFIEGNGERRTLQNHFHPLVSTSVAERLSAIRAGSGNVFTKKRNYVVLDEYGISQTITTQSGDYIHYSQDRNLTVREMARLQSFDDSFVFQGERATGGLKRRNSLPQMTMVGNAVPPLLARAIAESIMVVL